MRILPLLLLLFLIPLGAKNLSYQEVHSLPQGIAKDYYIWRFLRQKSTSRAQAKRIIREVSRINPNLKKAYRRKTGHNPPIPHPSLAQLSPRERKVLERKLSLTRRVLASSDPLAVWRRLSPPLKLFVFNHAGTRGRRMLDYPMCEAEWEKLRHYPDAKTMVHYVRRDRLKKLSRILRYKPAPNDWVHHNALMQAGFQALKHGDEASAEYNFAHAVKCAPKRELADRALFWAWKVSKNQSYLQKLVQSWSINLYTLASRDALKMNYDLGITPRLPRRHVPGFDIHDPVQWQKLKKKIFDPHTDLEALAERFKSEETVGQYCYIMSRAHNDKPQYFPMPYRDFMKKLPIKRQAILYAIARQESRFVPASISGSFALGMMQIMPFLVDHLQRVRHERIDYDDLFDPHIALKYANTHMDYVTSWLHHPLFVAYAYNAGIGFTKRLIRRRDLFENRSQYDPWISLERVANYQANDYGKKVLANYVIYLNKLGYPIRLTELLSVLHLPSYTDEFRKKRR